jgi:hypothetical protein
MKAYLLILTAILSGCTQSLNTDNYPPPEGELLAKLQITNGAFTGPIEDDTGYYFYISGEEKTPYNGGPEVTIYHYQMGDIVDAVGGGSLSSERFLEALARINFSPFDYDAELKKAIETSSNSPIADHIVYDSTDGYEWEIFISTENGDFYLRVWNPGADLNSYGPYNENIGKLRSVVQLFNSYYGEMKIGIF